MTLLVATKVANAQQDVAAELRKAAALHQQSDYAHSIPLLKQIVRQSPRDYEANLLLGEDLLSSSNIHEAIAPLEMACKVRPGDGTAEVFLAEAAVASDDFPRAAEALQAGIARSGGAGAFLESWASFCLQRLKILQDSLRTTKRGEATALRVEAAVHPEGSETREKVLEQSAAGDPEQRGIWGELGTAQLERGMVAQAKESLKEAQKREPEQAETLQLEALLAAVDRDWPAAEEKFAALGAKSPAEMQSAVKLWQHILAPRNAIAGATWDCLRDTKVACPAGPTPVQGGEGAKDLYAEGRWEQLIALPFPAEADTSGFLWRGVALAKTDKCEEAIPSLERGLKADELVAKFWLDVCYAGEGERVVARLSQQGDMTGVHRLRGDMLLILRSDAAGAATEYEAALKSDPRNPHLLAKLADAYMTVGNTEQADKAARAALAVDAHDASALRTLASLAIKERNYAEALVRLKQLAAIDPGDTWTQVQLGVAYGQLGHPEQAIHYLGPALAAGYPDSKGALHAMLASALRKLGRVQEAQRAADEAARLASSSLEDGGRGSTDARN
jgi:tetratricopeptide (TPR) repeat protein